MEKKQTAVEFYSKQHLMLLCKLERKELSLGEYAVAHQKILDQAMQLEKENSLDSFFAGFNYEGGHPIDEHDENYQKNYGKSN